MNIEEAHKQSSLINLLFGVEAILASSWSNLFLNGYQEDQVERIDFIFKNQKKIGFEVIFSTPPNLSMFADVVKIPVDPSLTEISNLFRLLPTSLAMNRFLGMHQCTHIGIDIFIDGDDILEISSQDDNVFKAGQKILFTSEFSVRKIKLYFINSLSYVNPSIIVRILGLTISDFSKILITAYKKEMFSYIMPDLELVTNYTPPQLFGFVDFIDYLENLGEIESNESINERKLFLRKTLIKEYYTVSENSIRLDPISKSIYENKANYII